MLYGLFINEITRKNWCLLFSAYESQRLSPEGQAFMTIYQNLE